MKWAKQTGFTIVELLIVIVVIAILAAITIVAYNGIQNRATYNSALTSLTQINRALATYNADKGQYPATGTTSAPGWRYYCGYQSAPANFIPGLSDVTTSIPAAPCKGGANSNDTWLYGSDGVGYKLVYIRPAINDDTKALVPTTMRDPQGWSSAGRWGYWTSDWAGV